MSGQSRQAIVSQSSAVPLKPLPATAARSGLLEGLAFLRDPGFADRRFAEHGDVFRTVLFGESMVFVRGGRAIEDLFAQSDRLSGWWPGSVRQLLGPLSLANRTGDAHRARRRVVGQLFTTAALRRYSPSLIALVDGLAEELSRNADPAEAGSREPVALAPLMRRFAFQVIATTVLGLGPEDRDALFADFQIWTRGLFAPPVNLPGGRFRRAQAARVRLLSRLQSILEQARRAVAAGGPPVSGGLDLLSGGLDEAGLSLTDDDVVEQLLLLLFAGYETTASTLSCLMLALLQQPEAAAWLDEELEGLSWPPQPERALTAYDASRAPRLDAVVREVMRLTPPVGGFFRRSQEPIALAGVAVPAGQVIQVSLAATNQLADGDGDQERSGIIDLDRFRPQRHLEPGGSGVTLLPFGGGERVCLGKALAELEIRLLAVGVLRRLRFSLAPDQDLSLEVIPSPTPRDGLRVLVSRREP
ncbi:cytochrome P450 [Synechococcus sp. RSCCF101]|uniref:cytochrome P450 n=1 Tax=Synechococcus sp. RSCCF101 TaxID=2511069 RepID=UPI0012490AF9|nr:cytochrome P450 [Synechococcus sp. RSCCF101]QEY31567.1 cytochrome P450 [Synechococcus sp. RSCCF101]